MGDGDTLPSSLHVRRPEAPWREETDDDAPGPDADHVRPLRPGEQGRSRRDYQGAPAWSRAAEHYFGKMVPQRIAEERRAWREWWTHPDVLVGLMTELPARYLEEARQRGPLIGEAERASQVFASRVLDAVILLEQHQGRMHELARDLGRSMTWLNGQQRQIRRLVREKYLPYTHPHRPPGPRVNGGNAARYRGANPVPDAQEPES